MGVLAEWTVKVFSGDLVPDHAGQEFLKIISGRYCLNEIVNLTLKYKVLLSIALNAGLNFQPPLPLKGKNSHESFF